ncbi:hypothetical protein GF324_01705 [bacterium]|nr:hypothetical protein [bacterium]
MKRFTLIFALMIAIPFAASAQNAPFNFNMISFGEQEVNEEVREYFTLDKSYFKQGYEIMITGKHAKMFTLYQLDGEGGSESRSGNAETLPVNDKYDRFALAFASNVSGNFEAVLHVNAYGAGEYMVMLTAKVADDNVGSVTLPYDLRNVDSITLPGDRPSKVRIAR